MGTQHKKGIPELIRNTLFAKPICGFCIGKKNWVMIDTVAGAKSSAIIYSIAETAKVNSLKPYDYFEYLLTEITKHLASYIRYQHSL